jgi:poly-gamma-glutamate synthesis protein (capsule biosynthesis protein)
VLNLANNHILDQGSAGLMSTIDAAAAADIATVGAGRNLAEARRILIRKVRGFRVGILGIAEREFSIATATAPGANPIDLIDITRNISAQRGKMDYLVVLLHGGNEYYPFPSPRLMETCRFLVEQGANAVVCQHSHCVGCCEEYHGGHIVYGQGSLICDTSGVKSGLASGIVIRLRISENGISRMDFVPSELFRGGMAARKMAPYAAKSLLQSIATRSESLKKHGFIESEWRAYCVQKKHEYVSMILGHGRILRRLNRHGQLVRLLYPLSSQLVVRNLIQCDAHRDILETVMGCLNDEA